MKKYLYLFFVGILLLGSCSKEPIPPIEEPSPYWGTITAERNGEPWSADPYAFININDRSSLNLNSVVFSEFNIRKESMSIKKIPFLTGTYPVVNSSASVNDSNIGASFFFVDYDVILAHYEILESDSSSFITLSSYDLETEEVKGSFDLTFIAKNKNEAYNFPDTVRFRNGTFHTKVTEL